MKVPLSWVSDYVVTELSPSELAHRLTMSGTEVESVLSVGADWANISVGQVVGLTPHPNADRLKLATVDLGQEQLTVVCGAPNVAEGQKVPFARVGARIIEPRSGSLVTLEAANIRGVPSQGMVCSEKELGISGEHLGIMILPPEAPLGVPLVEYLGDHVFDLAVTPNRPDCLSIMGVAQEISALTGAEVRRPEDSYEEDETLVNQLASVEIEDGDLCPRYTASVVRGVKVGESPLWMQDRLLKAGVRPINNVVDITNYVMMEYGQPLHAFDYDKVSGHKIVVRRAKVGEKLLTLDGLERILEPWMLVIADGEGPVALAGIMGGSKSEVTEKTTTILLESANFNNLNIRRSAQVLRMRSEASLRLEKELGVELPPVGLQRGTQLLVGLCSGQAARGIIDVYPGRKVRPPVRLTRSRLEKVLGIGVDQGEMIKILHSLGFRCDAQGPENLLATPPYWRTDINIEDDLIEEVVRIKGFDQLPTVSLGKPLPQTQPDPMLVLKDKARDVLVSLGMQEVISYSLTGSAVLGKANVFMDDSPPLKVSNPMSAEQEYLRTSLRGSVLSTLAFNQRWQHGGLRLFELGRIYRPREGNLPEEREMLAGVMSGHRSENSWAESGALIDFFDAKGTLEALLVQLGLEAKFKPGVDNLLVTGKVASVEVGGDNVGTLGEVSPVVSARFDLREEPVFYFEVDLQCLPRMSLDSTRHYRPVLRYPGVNRDLSLVLDVDVSASHVLALINGHPMVEQVEIFDVYVGDQIPAGKKSLALRILFQSSDKTLANAEVNQAQDELLDKARNEFGAVLRD